MKYIFSNQVIDFAMLFLMIWNLWIFIFNKSKKRRYEDGCKEYPSVYSNSFYILYRCINGSGDTDRYWDH